MRKIKVAQIGAGHDHASAAMQVLKRMDDIFELVGYAVVEGDDIYERSVSAYENVKRMTVDEIFAIPDLDAVVIETEDRKLTEYAQMAAERGLHIQMDKPGSASDEAFDKLIDTVKTNNTVFQTGYMYRFNPAVLKIKEDIKEGKLGEIYSVEVHMDCEHPAEKRQWLGNYPGGMMYFLGCHLVDLIYSFCGVPEEIIPLNKAIGAEGVTAEDFGMAVFKYKNGVSFAKTSALEPTGFYRRQLVVCGTKGTVEVKPFEWNVRDCPQSEKIFSAQITKVRYAYNTDEKKYGWNDIGNEYETEIHGRYDAMFKNFAALVRGEKENAYDYEYERQLHKIILNACGVKVDYK